MLSSTEFRSCWGFCGWLCCGARKSPAGSGNPKPNKPGVHRLWVRPTLATKERMAEELHSHCLFHQKQYLATPYPILGINSLRNFCFLLVCSSQSLILFAVQRKRDEQLSKKANLNYNEGAHLPSTESLLFCGDSFFLNCADSVPHQGCGHDDYYARF